MIKSRLEIAGFLIYQRNVDKYFLSAKISFKESCLYGII